MCDSCGGDKAGGQIGQLLQMLGVLGGGGSAPNAQDILADNPVWQAGIQGLDDRFLDADRFFEAMGGEANALQARREANLNKTGITPDFGGIEGLEFLSNITNQFQGTDPTLLAAALGMQDRERIGGNHLNFKAMLDQMKLGQGQALSGMLIPAQQGFAGAQGQAISDILQTGQQGIQIEDILKFMAQNQQSSGVMNFLQKLFESQSQNPEAVE